MKGVADLGDVWQVFIVITEDIFVMLEKLIKSQHEVIDNSYDNVPV
jgi:hypothetical protein